MTAPGDLIERREYVVEPECPGRLARAFALYQLTRPSAFVAAGLFLLSGAIGVLSAAGWLVAISVFGLLMIVMTAITRYRGVSRLLAAGAYQPGRTVSTEWYADNVVIRTADAHWTHYFRDVRKVTSDPDTVLVALRTSRTVLMLPVDLVGERGRDLLAAGGSARRP